MLCSLLIVHCSLRLGEGQQNAEHTADAFAALDCNCPAMQRDDCADEIQPDAQAADAQGVDVAGPEKPLEQSMTLAEF